MRADLGAFQAEHLPHFDADFLAMHLQDVRAEWSQEAHLQDVADRGETTPGRARQARSVREALAAQAAAVPGLVSVPTSGQATFASKTAAESSALQKSLRATVVDKRVSRIASLRRAVGFSARAIGATLDRPGFRAHYVAMLTLTYANLDDWNPRHVSGLLLRVRRFLQSHGVRMHYVWVAELQKRGALHYHIALWLPHGFTIPFPDKAGWWPHGSTNIKEARRAVPYLLKYLSKGIDTDGFPRGARIHGSGGMEHALKRSRRWLGLPAFIKARSDIHDDWRRAPGGGWCDPDGVIVPSEYERAWIGDRWACTQVVNYGRPFDAAGAFSWIHRGQSC